MPEIYSPSSNMFCLVEFEAFQQAYAFVLTLQERNCLKEEEDFYSKRVYRS